ncbi:Uncharacterized protein OnM2_056019 [Erysiphe neolycopersici]|uniref:Uncharacterized protein n=1 Tax=Erysiphe neolycopersici TaxID=212602 RepID=A0A420HQY0_9PEZI|nr:Uncharacterized protein OnM2_056019 [Erysiphe neolycopersici]
MPPQFTLQRPYVISSLPNSVGSYGDTYFISEVYGGSPGQKKRKRSELAVGINGEGVNLYDISASRLTTSYAIPPQSIFTCPPCSIRIRISKAKVERRTYISSRGIKPRITLFHDTKDGSTQAQIREVSKDVEGSSSPVVFIGCMVSEQKSDDTGYKTKVVLVKDDCEIQCYNSDDLRHEWTSPASTLFQESHSTPDDARVEFAQITTVHCASQGILRNRKDIMAVFPQEVQQFALNLEILILITKSEKNCGRTLHIVSLPRRQASTIGWTNHCSVDTLLTYNLPHNIQTENSEQKVSFSLDVSAGILQQLEHDVLTVIDIVDPLPKEKYKINSPRAKSLLRLSSTATMTLAADTISVFSTKSQSCLATVSVDLKGLENLKRQINTSQNFSQASRLLSYFPKLGIAVAIVGNSLIGIQIEGQRDRYGSMRVCGLLIDSLGCSTNNQARHMLGKKPSRKEKKFKIQTLKCIQPLSWSDQQSWLKLLQPIEESFAKGDCIAEVFDQFMQPYLTTSSSKFVYSTQFQKFDKRWAIYAISKIFTISQLNVTEPHLSISLRAPNTLMWLVQNGLMTKSNIESGLRYQGAHIDYILPGELTRIIIELDSEMELLRALVLNTHLEADELLYIIRILMGSLGLCGRGKSFKEKSSECNNSKLLANQLQDPIEIIEAEVKQDIEYAEGLLKFESQIRNEALTIALSKLYVFPDDIIICALKKTYDPQTVVSLIYLLRMELARGGWTANYLDPEDNRIDDDNISTPDNIIVLISTLLNCCVDAIGAGGWLSGEARLVDGDPLEAQRLITNLKAEVSLLLEGIEEMIYLKNILAEMVRYSEINFKEFTVNTKKDALTPQNSSLASHDTALLPLGMKVERQISTSKISIGGEVTRRSKRDIGDRKSRKVGKYSRERIII